MEQQQQVEVTPGQAAPMADAPAQEAPEQTSAPEPTAGAEQARSEPKDDEQTKKVLRGVQKRINELTRDKYEAEQRGREEAEKWRQAAIAQAQELERLQRAQPGPKWEDYGDIEKYTAARAQYEADRIVRERMAQADQQRNEAQERERAQQQAQAQHDAFQRVVAEKIAEASKKYPDFIDVVTSPELPGLQGTAAFGAILDSELGAEIMYHLGKNPQKAHHIASLSPISQAREIGRIESAIAQGKVVSTAPPPAENVNSGKAGGPKDPSKMSYDEFVTWRRRSLAQRR